MKAFTAAVAAMALLTAAPSAAMKAAKAIQPLAPALVGKVVVAATTVEIDDKAKAHADKLEAKAADKRAAAETATADPAGTTGAAHPTPGGYETLPLATMLPLEISDVTHAWGLVAGRPVKLVVTIDAIRTANAGMAMLIGSSDELAGTVDVLDAADGEQLAKYRVAVVNTSAGWLGLALRGSGVREKLAAAFAAEIAIKLSGNKHRPKTQTAS